MGRRILTNSVGGSGGGGGRVSAGSGVIEDRNAHEARRGGGDSVDARVRRRSLRVLLEERGGDRDK